MRKFFVVLSTLLFVICICSACGKTVVVDENCEQCHAAIVGKWSCLTKDEALRQVIFNEDGTCSLNNKKDEWSTACYGDVHNVRIRSTREFIRFDETKLYYDGNEYLNGKRYRYVRVDYNNWSKFFSSDFYELFELQYEYCPNSSIGKAVSCSAVLKDSVNLILHTGIAIDMRMNVNGMPSTITLNWGTPDLVSVEYSGDITDVSNVTETSYLTSYSNPYINPRSFPLGLVPIEIDPLDENKGTFIAPMPVEITGAIYGWVLIEN